MSIVVAGLSYAYEPSAPVLRDISTELRAGELAFVAGASGSGKTTLMRCINGLIPHRYARGAMSGGVILDGQPVPTLSLLRVAERVGTVMQDPERQMVATHVMDEIAFGLENVALPREQVRARVQHHAERLGIAPLLERPIASLSGGEKQKVAIAGVLVMSPRAVLLDEPLASLDPASSREAMAWFRGLANDGVAVIVVEHRHGFVLDAQPDHCLNLEDGRLTFDGSADEFPRRPPPAQRDIAPTRADAPTLIALENVRFQHKDGALALRGVNLNVRKGDVIALMGANGAGKSTLCKHLIGLLRPTQGRVMLGVNGASEPRDIRELTVAQIAQQLGYVFQSPGAMLFEKTLRDELSFGPKNAGLSDDAIGRNVRAAADTVGLGERLNDSPFALSFGQQKRASVAAVLAMGPRVLALDEPTAGQDYDNVLRLMDELTQRRALDALIVATHDLELARAFANRCVVMSGGEIVADGEPERILADEALLARCRLR